MFRRSGQRDDRRRRVLTEEVVNGGKATKSKSSSSNKPAAHYGEAAELHRRGRIVDLVPRRAWVHALGLFGGAGVIAGLLGLYHAAGPGTFADGAENWRALNLSSAGSLAAWFNSACLLLVGAAALVVYSLRRHKMSDYKSTYRLWLWTAVTAIVASSTVTAGWHLALGDWLSASLGWKLPGGEAAYHFGLGLAVVAVLGLRLLLEMRSCKLATLGLLLAITALGTSLGYERLADAATSMSTIVMVEVGSRLAASLLLLLSIGWYARYVIQDVQGLIAVKPAKDKAKSKKPAGVDSAHKTPPAPKGKSDLDIETPRQRRRREQAEMAQEAFEEKQAQRFKNKNRNKGRGGGEVDAYDDDEPQQGQRKLSKSERKRLRKLKAQQREI